MSSLNQKEKILARIREANSIPREREVPVPDFESGIYTRPGDEEDQSVLFARRFVNAAGKLVYCDSDKDLLDKLSSFLEKEELKHRYVFDEELSIKLYQGNIRHHTSDKDFIAKAQVGITYCEYLIARTGSILISTRLGGGRMLNVYPPVHVVCANLSQLVYDIEEALIKTHEKYDKDEKPSMMSLITGPSRTADIEKTLVMGAHGPKELILFLVDDL